MFDVGPGELLRGMTPPAEARHGLVAVAVEPAVLASVDAAQLRKPPFSCGTKSFAFVTSRVGGNHAGFFHALVQLDSLSEGEDQSRLEKQALLNHRLTAQALDNLVAVAKPSFPRMLPLPRRRNCLFAAQTVVGRKESNFVRRPARWMAHRTPCRQLR